ncbi:MAG: aconitate hydratase, partial [Lysobacteraceae bacterium]
VDLNSGWDAIEVAQGERYPWREASTYIRRPPYFDELRPVASGGIGGARALLVLGDNISTDHISPVGGIAKDAPAGLYLAERGTTPDRFNNYGARRSNHEVMARAAFANERLRNHLLPGTEGGVTMHMPTGAVGSVFDVAMRYRGENIPLLILAGHNYGVGSSRDWAARGPWFLGVAGVVARSFERIHRSNLIAMGILPVEFDDGDSVESLGLTGTETFEIAPASSEKDGIGVRSAMRVVARSDDGGAIEFEGVARIDSADELRIFKRGGVLPYLLERFAAQPGQEQEALRHVDARA